MTFQGIVPAYISRIVRWGLTSSSNLLQGVVELNSAPKKAKPTLQLEVDGAILKEEDTVFTGRLKRSIALPESY